MLKRQWNLKIFFYSLLGTFYVSIFLLAMVVIIVTAQKTITSYTSNIRLEMLVKNKQHLEYQLKQVEDIAVFILTENSLNQLLSNSPDKSYESLLLIRSLDNVLDKYLYIKPDIENIFIYSDSLLGYPTSERHIKSMNDFKWKNIKNELIFSDSFWVTDNLKPRIIDDHSETDTISYLMQIRNSRNILKGYIEIVVNQKIISDYIDTSVNELNESSALLLLNSKNNILLQLYNKKIVYNIQDELNLPVLEGYKSINNGKELLIYTSAKNNQWRMVELVGSGVINKRVKEIIKSLMIGAFILLILFFPLVTVISKIIIIPIKRLINGFEKIKIGDFSEKRDKYFIKEFDGLFISFFNMNNRLTLLIKSLKDEQEKKRRAELKALQSQINPHFLYNTLDMINWMAIEKGYSEISRIVVKLSRLFRICLNNGNALIKLNTELEHSRLFSQIQQARYNNSFKYIENIDEELLNSFVPKIIVQPFVENSIIHGFHDKNIIDPTISITVKTIDSNRYVIIIEDNGTGLEREDLKEISSTTRKSGSLLVGGYGVKNVQERIQLYFGSSYGLKLSNKSEGGVRVEMTLPIINKIETFITANGESVG